MNRISGLMLFLIVFFLVYFGIHFYVFYRFSGFFNLNRGVLFYLVLVLLAASFPVMSIIARYSDNIFTRIFYTASAAWLGALFFAFCSLLVYEVVRLIFHPNIQVSGIVIFVFVMVISLYAIANAVSANVKNVQIPVANLEKEMKIVQISDVHLGTVHKKAYLQEIVDRINKENPKMVLITGDLFDGGGDVTLDMLSPLRNLNARVFFATGNHEQYEGLDEVFSLLNKTNVTILRNSVVDYMGIQIIGIDNPTQEFVKTNTALQTIKFNKSKPSILMFHPPTGFEDASAAGISLQLSGHTHAGQIFPFNLIGRAFYKYFTGVYKLNDTYLYVSPGTGTWGPPMRLGSKSEITVLDLVKKK